MPSKLSTATIMEIGNILTSAGNDWADLHAYIQLNITPATPAPNKSDIDAEWVKATAEAILKSNCKLSANAQSFVAQTFARANQYQTVKFSPKQWEWLNKIMLDAGVEALDLPVEVKP